MNKLMNKLALSGLVGAMAVTAAQAEPLTLTPVQMDTVTASGFGFASFDAFVSAFKNFNTNIHFAKHARVNVEVDIDGYLADANAVSNCAGFGCTAETFTGADANAFLGTGTAASHSVAAADLPDLFDD